MRRSYYRKLMTLAAMSTGGALFSLLSCDPFPALVNGISSVNPCPIVFLCLPAEYSFITSGYEGPGVDPSLDIFCTYPPFCTPEQDPIYGGIFGGAP